MPLIADSSPMGTGGSPNLSAIIANIKAMILKGVNGNDLIELFDDLQTISQEWNFTANPKFGTNNGFLKSTSGVLSFASLATVATTGVYSDLTGKPTIPAILSDLSSPTTAFNFGNQELRNLSKIIIGANATSDYMFDIENCNFTPNLVGTNKSSIKLSGVYTADCFNTIDMYYNSSATEPSGRFGYQFTGSGSFFCVSTSNNYGNGTTHFNFSSGFFPTENMNGIKVAEALLFTTNNIGSIGTSGIAVANIYSVNALNITSDKRDKIIDEKLNLKKDFSFEFLEKLVKNCIISWKWNPTVIPEKKINSFEKITRKNKETNIDEIDYILTTKTIEPEKIIEHKRNHMGLNLNEFYKLMVEFNLSTKDYAFLSINDTYELKSFDSEGNEIIEIKNSFNELGDPILDPDGYPLGKMTYKPQELQSLLFIYSFELHKRDLEKNKKIDDLEKRLDDLEKQMKILLKK